MFVSRVSVDDPRLTEVRRDVERIVAAQHEQRMRARDVDGHELVRRVSSSVANTVTVHGQPTITGNQRSGSPPTELHKTEVIEPRTIVIIMRIFGGLLYRPMR
ncbi:hypothetical protein OPT61_g8001 [Boeremia exigua]|uniref:Uncharacterized protein n=1 Tax=Boeremia exigua TaxID=749465 RepID=A0ACC2HZY8_9PLEO|nr:hypothetical protein OPT61_g8001 [Boeremia exigua]